jgi:hypothetical protein
MNGAGVESFGITAIEHFGFEASVRADTKVCRNDRADRETGLKGANPTLILSMNRSI